MKQLSRKLQITYRWWRDDRRHIKQAHVEALEDRAMERIQRMMRDGCTSGELQDNIYMTARDPADGVEYTGWWELKKEE